jgi:Ca-activated chloride channel family protein
MNFENTVWLYLTAIVVLLSGAIIAVGLRKRESLLGKFAAARLLDQLTERASNTRTLIKSGCVVFALAAVCIALARPQYGVEWSERKARGLDIVFVLDSSKSMLATDIRPSRLDRAKLAVIDLIERLESDRIGLVAFAGRAFLQAPPTLDYSAFLESLDSIGPATMTSGGSDIGNAIKEAEKAFPKDNNFKVIILLTDGEDLGGNAIDTAKAAAANGIKVYAIGIGTPEGEYLRIRNERGEEEFIRDDAGQPVRSQLDEATLQQIAQVTGGSYSRLSSQSLNALYDSVISTLPREEREAEMQETAIERYQWLIGLALILLVVEILIRRRGSPQIRAALFAIALSPALPQPAQAQGEDTIAPETFVETIIPDDPRLAYNQAYDALISGDNETAKRLYESSIANTNDRALQRDALYNLAHAKNQSARDAYNSGDIEKAFSEIKEAEALFKSVEEIDPNDFRVNQDIEKVTAVREAIEKLTEQPQEQEEQNQENSEENQDPPEPEQSEEDSEQDQQGDKQNSEESQEDNQDGKQQDSGEQSQDGEQGESSESGEPSDQQDDSDSEQSQGDQGEPSGEQGESPSGEPGSEEASTRNPVDDMAQAEEEDGEQAGDGEQAADGEQAGVPQPSEGEADEEGQAGEATGSMMTVEGMTQEDATALLESLRSGEKLLPFVEQGTPRDRGKVRDW